MPALAITDHGNMFGVKEFFKFAKKHPSVKPIIGCEIYVSKGDHRIKEKGYYHLILLAKNYKGYQNLVKIVSEAHINGMYYRPRVSHEVIEKYHEGLICSSACIAGEVPRAIMARDFDAAEKAIQWHKDLFGEDYYLEVMKHPTRVPGLSNQIYEDQCYYCGEIFRLACYEIIRCVETYQRSAAAGEGYVLDLCFRQHFGDHFFDVKHRYSPSFCSYWFTIAYKVII